MSGLPREILKWMQSLDLSYSVRNSRRDFSNGFLVAEIFNRYYRSDVQMHSFDNGTSLTRKRDNWEQLEKFFEKMGFEISHNEIEEVIHCNAGAVAPLINKIYTILTGKEVRAAPPLENEEYIPPFARPTTSALVKLRLNAPDLKEKEDVTLSTKQAEEVVHHHDEILKVERVDRHEQLGQYSPRHILGSNSRRSRAEPRKVQETSADGVANIQFKKEVNVKPVSSAAQIKSRAQSRAQSKLSNNAGSRQNNDVASVLNACIQDNIHSGDITDQFLLEQFARGQNATSTFVTYIEQLPDAWICTVLRQIEITALHEIVSACVSNPREFFKLMSLVWECITHASYDLASFACACSLLERIGVKLLGTDELMAWEVLNTSILPKLAPVLQSEALKVHGLARVVYAFVQTSPRHQHKLLKTLKRTVNDDATFTDCVSAFIQIEEHLTNEHLQVYMDVVSQGLQAEASHVKASYVSVLASIALHNDTDVKGSAVVSNMLGDIVALKDTNPTWEVHGSIVHVLASLLLVTDEGDPRAQHMYGVIQELLHHDANPLTLRMGLTWLSICIGVHQAMRKLWMTLLIETPDVRAALLEDLLCVKQQRSSPEPSIQHRIPPINSVWHSLSVSMAILENVEVEKPDNLSPAHVELLSAAVTSQGNIPEEESKHWRHVFVSLRDYVMVELYDERLCTLAVKTIEHFLLDASVQPVALSILTAEQGQAPPFFGVLKLVFKPDSSPVCQQEVCGLLASIVRVDSVVFHPPVYNLVKNFAQIDADNFNTSPLLQTLLSDLEQMQS